MSPPTGVKDKPFANVAQGKPKFYLTTPIYYANSRPHVGSAYTTIVCDVIARYKRMCGYDVAYLTGTDEHGVNIERAAEAKGITPQQLVDANEAIFRDLWKLLGITHTDFIRTTSQEHARAVEKLVLRTLELDRGRPDAEKAIYKSKYEGRYCIYDNLVRERHAGAGEMSDVRARRGIDFRGELLFQAVGVSGEAARTLQEPAAVRAAGFSAE